MSDVAPLGMRIKLRSRFYRRPQRSQRTLRVLSAFVVNQLRVHSRRFAVNLPFVLSWASCVVRCRFARYVVQQNPFGCGSAAPGSSVVKARVLSFHLDFDAADPLGDKIVDQGAERPEHKPHRSVDNGNEDGEAGTESQYADAL